MRCPYCESEKIEKSMLMSGGHSVLVALTTKSFFEPSKISSVSANVCLDCGKLFDFEVDKLSRLNRDNSKK